MVHLTLPTLSTIVITRKGLVAGQRPGRPEAASVTSIEKQLDAVAAMPAEAAV